jgi:preprotein translocase subunit SecB
MITLPSELQLNSFVVLRSIYEFVPPQKGIKGSFKILKTYDIDIDFSHKENKNGDMQVFTKIAVNLNEKPLPGYKLFVEGTAVFSIEKKDTMKDDDEKNLKYYSTVSILIGYLRGTLSSLTASSPFGVYVLPPIDMADLFRKKMEKNKP